MGGVGGATKGQRQEWGNPGSLPTLAAAGGVGEATVRGVGEADFAV